MSFKTLLLTGLLSVGLVLVGCSKKKNQHLNQNLFNQMNKLTK